MHLSLFFFFIAALADPTGDQFVSNLHSLTRPLTSNDTYFPEATDIKEWHFHVYWFQNNPSSYETAMQIRSELLDLVSTKKMIVVLNGVTEDMVPGLNTSNIPKVNTQPIGPHPCGSYEVWTPKEYLPQALSYFMMNRRELSILLHPLSAWEVEDHSGRAMWLGPSYRIDYSALSVYETQFLEYPELGLGYSAKS